jgi:transposase
MIADFQYIGIDISKLRLDVHIHPVSRRFTVDNNRSGLRQLIARLRCMKVKGIGLEATGGYERLAADALVAAGFTVYYLHPAQVRDFAKSMKALAKTDVIDAAMIARYVGMAADVLVPHKPDEARECLAELNAYRRMLIAERNSHKSLLDTTGEAVVRRLIQKRLKDIAREIRILERQIKAHVADDPRLAEPFTRLKSLPGVGPVLAATLISDLPELGQIGAKRIASLVGVAPHARQSGQTSRAGRCVGGRKSVRDVLYMAALSAIKAKMPHLEPFYSRLRQTGKPFKKVMVAVMRKFLTIINAIIRDKSELRTKSA